MTNVAHSWELLRDNINHNESEGLPKLAAFILRCWNQADAYQHS